MTRIFTIEEIKDVEKVDLLSKHGTIFPLTAVASGVPMPVIWNTYEMSKWIQACLAVEPFDYSRDYLALTGNYLALGQLIATLIAQDASPYNIKCLAFSRSKNVNEYSHVVLEEFVPHAH